MDSLVKWAILRISENNVLKSLIGYRTNHNLGSEIRKLTMNQRVFGFDEISCIHRIVHNITILFSIRVTFQSKIDDVNCLAWVKFSYVPVHVASLLHSSGAVGT